MFTSLITKYLAITIPIGFIGGLNATIEDAENPVTWRKRFEVAKTCAFWSPLVGPMIITISLADLFMKFHPPNVNRTCEYMFSQYTLKTEWKKNKEN